MNEYPEPVFSRRTGSSCVILFLRLVLADFKFRLENHLNPNGLNGCSWSLLRAVTLNSHCMVMVGISSQRLMRIFSYIDTCKSQAVLG